MNDGKDKYLCAMPNTTIEMTAERRNETKRTLMDESKSSSEASRRGLESLRGLEGVCLYWISGWWSYEFCYSSGVKQYHALNPLPGVSIFPPREDPNAGSYVLGQRPKSLLTTGTVAGKDTGALAKIRNTGISKSLVVNYDKGTYCPLIDQERQVEVQFQCSPSTNDHIAFVKEVSSCQYLLLVRTARLCHDEAFQVETTSTQNTIHCTKVVNEQITAKNNDFRQTSLQHGQAVNVDPTDRQHAYGDDQLELVSQQSTADTSSDLAGQSDTTRPPPYVLDQGQDEAEIRNSALAMAKKVASQLEDGTLTIGGKSIFDTANEDVKYNVELQDENGDTLGTVQISVVDSALVIEIADLSGFEAAQELKQKENEAAQKQMPDSVRRNFDDFIQHAEL